MIDSKDISEFLDEIERLNPQLIHSGLDMGDEFSTHPYPTSTQYVVDDLDAHKDLSTEEDFGRFLLELNENFKPSTHPAEVLNHYFPPGKKVCGISRIAKDRVGMCLEKSTMVSLRLRGAKSVHLVKGVLAVRGSTAFHAFNVMNIDGDKTNLVDAQHPIIVRRNEERIYYSFNYPLSHLDPDNLRFAFEEPYESQLQWQYYLPRNIKLP